MYRKPVKIARFSNGIQNRLALKRFSLIWAVPAKSMKAWSRLPSVGTGSPNASSQCVPKIREPERSFVIVVYEYPAVNQKIVGNSSHSNSMPAEQIDVIILLLSDLALLARRRDGRRQLTGAALHV